MKGTEAERHMEEREENYDEVQTTMAHMILRIVIGAMSTRARSTMAAGGGAGGEESDTLRH